MIKLIESTRARFEADFAKAYARRRTAIGMFVVLFRRVEFDWRVKRDWRAGGERG